MCAVVGGHENGESAKGNCAFALRNQCFVNLVDSGFNSHLRGEGAIDYFLIQTCVAGRVVIFQFYNR